MQNHQFEMALRQAKALDKRNNEDGKEVFDLGESFLDKEYYDLFFLMTKLVAQMESYQDD